MGITTKSVLRSIAALSVVLLSAVSAAADAQPACDRECLHAIAWSYMDAMARHDITGQPLAAHVKATENLSPVKPGEGLFTSVIHFEYPRQYVADARTGQIGVMGVLEDWVGEGLFSIRLKVESGKIAEIETQISHDGESGWAFEPVGFLFREAPYIAAIPAKIRTPREELFKIAQNYWNIVTTTKDPSKIAYTDSCVHVENGMNTDWEHILSTEAFQTQHAFAAGPEGRHFTCYSDVEASPWGADTGVRGYRAIADEERGLVMVWNLMDIGHGPKGSAGPDNGGKAPSVPDVTAIGNQFQKYTAKDHFTLDDMPVGLSMRGMAAAMAGPRTVYNVEVQRILGGKIDRHQLFMRNLPDNFQSPW